MQSLFRVYSSREPCPQTSCDAQEFEIAGRRTNGDCEFRFFARSCECCRARTNIDVQAPFYKPAENPRGGLCARLFGASDGEYKQYSVFVDLKVAAAMNLQDFAAKGNTKMNVHLGSIQCYKKVKPDLVLAYNTILPFALGQYGDKFRTTFTSRCFSYKQVLFLFACYLLFTVFVVTCQLDAPASWGAEPSLKYNLLSIGLLVTVCIFLCALTRRPVRWAQRIIHTSSCTSSTCNGECVGCPDAAQAAPSVIATPMQLPNGSPSTPGTPQQPPGPTPMLPELPVPVPQAATEHADGTEQYVSLRLDINDEGVVEMRPPRYDEVVGIGEGQNQHGTGKHVDARVDPLFKPYGLWEILKPGAYAIGPDLIPSDVKPNSIGALLRGLIERLEKKVLPYDPKPGLEEELHESVKALKAVFTAEKVRAWRAANPMIALMKSGKWTTPRFYEAYDRLLSEMGLFELQHKFQVKRNEVLPVRGKSPRPLCSDGDIGNVANLITIKFIEDVLFGCQAFKGHFRGHHVKHQKKLAAVQEIMRNLRHNKKDLTSVMGDGSAWDSCEGPEIRDVIENPLIEHVAKLLLDDIEVPNWVTDAAIRARKGKKMRGSAETVDTAPNGRKLLSFLDVRAIRRSGDRGTSVLNYVMNLVVWLTILSEDAPKLLANPATRNHVSRLSGKRVWMNYGFEGDDSVLSTDDDLKKYEARIREDWQSLGFHMKLDFRVSDEALTFVGYIALCNKHGPRDDIIMPELLRNIASSAWTCSHLAATRKGCTQIGAEAYASRATAFLETAKPIGRLFRGYALGHHKNGACLSTDSRELQMQHTGKYDEHLSFNLGEMMQDAEDNSLWTDDTEDDFMKLINLQSGGVADLFDVASLMSIDGPLDPYDIAAARYFIPEAWRTDPDVVEAAGDNIEQQG